MSKPRLGRPPVAGVRSRPITVTLTPDQIARLRELGNGNVSAGVRKMVEVDERVTAIEKRLDKIDHDEWTRRCEESER